MSRKSASRFQTTQLFIPLKRNFANSENQVVRATKNTLLKMLDAWTKKQAGALAGGAADSAHEVGLFSFL